MEGTPSTLLKSRYKIQDSRHSNPATLPVCSSGTTGWLTQKPGDASYPEPASDSPFLTHEPNIMAALHATRLPRKSSNDTIRTTRRLTRSSSSDTLRPNSTDSQSYEPDGFPVDEFSQFSGGEPFRPESPSPYSSPSSGADDFALNVVAPAKPGPKDSDQVRVTMTCVEDTDPFGEDDEFDDDEDDEEITDKGKDLFQRSKFSTVTSKWLGKSHKVLSGKKPATSNRQVSPLASRGQEDIFEFGTHLGSSKPAQTGFSFAPQVTVPAYRFSTGPRPFWHTYGLEAWKKDRFKVTIHPPSDMVTLWDVPQDQDFWLSSDLFIKNSRIPPDAHCSMPPELPVLGIDLAFTSLPLWSCPPPPSQSSSSSQSSPPASPRRFLRATRHHSIKFKAPTIPYGSRDQHEMFIEVCKPFQQQVDSTTRSVLMGYTIKCHVRVPIQWLNEYRRFELTADVFLGDKETLSPEVETIKVSSSVVVGIELLHKARNMDGKSPLHTRQA